MKKEFLFASLFIAVLSFISIIGLLIHKGQPTTFDARVHITSIAQFSEALLQGNLPVIWLSNFANYGLPVGLFAQQLPLYIGGIINIVLQNPNASYILLMFLSVFVSGVLFYKFLRLYVTLWASLVGVTVLIFAPFRIIDTYVRGDLPEIFSSIFLPLILLCMYYFVNKKSALAYFGLILSIAGLVLSHPMVFVIYAFIFVPYFFFLIYKKFHTILFLLQKEGIIYTLCFFLSIAIGMGLAGYYLLPLALETKYFFFINEPTHFDKNQILGLANFFSPFWYRDQAQFIKVGLLEMVGVIIYIVYSARKLMRKSFSFDLGEFTILICLLYIFFLLHISYPIYEHTFLAEVQFSWRMLAGFIFLPPILFALFINKINKKWVAIIFILFICLIRSPQLYGKHFIIHPNSYYEFTPLNLYSANMNTLWMQNPEDYPVKSTKAEILEHGKGTVVSSVVTNVKRTYVIDAKQRLHMIDYTFYFPGWTVYIDNQPTTIEFQNYLYKGVITYYVPAGKHIVTVVFKDTMVRKIGKIVSSSFILLFILLVLLRNKLFFITGKNGKEKKLLFLGFGR